jgi:hypothetical protein
MKNYLWLKRNGLMQRLGLRKILIVRLNTIDLERILLPGSIKEKMMTQRDMTLQKKDLMNRNQVQVRKKKRNRMTITSMKIKKVRGEQLKRKIQHNKKLVVLELTINKGLRQLDYLEKKERDFHHQKSLIFKMQFLTKKI